MNKTNWVLRVILAFLLLSGLWSKVGAAAPPARLLFKDGKVWALEGAKLAALTENVELPNNITVSTNGTFQVGKYSPRSFLEGQILGADGMLTSPNGRIEPVINHVALDAGKTVSSIDGGKSLVKQDLPLGADQRLTPDRVLLGGERGWMRVIDGLLFTSDGKVIPALDTISLQNGKVIVQKEGTRIGIEPGRSIMMNEGTKVFGDGKVLKRDGTSTQLSEGQVLTIEGVVKLR